MKINSYNNNEQYINLKEKADISAENRNINSINEHENNMNIFMNSTDSIEISENSKQLNLIKNRIEGGFYDNPNVLKKVAEKILNTINEKV